MNINKFNFLDMYSQSFIIFITITIKLMRKVYLLRQREKSFDISYHINDKPLPTYNALDDPFL